MIEVRGLDKWYGSRRALHTVDLEVPAGSVTAVLGLNGAGKTTLLRLIAGLDRPGAGIVRVCGRDPEFGLTSTGVLGVHLGPEAMNPAHTVQRHLSWLAALGGFGPGDVRRVIAVAGIGTHRRTRIGALSPGSRQRLAIAGALLGDPRVLMLDEPVNALDVRGVVWLRSLLRDLAADGRTVLLASHALGEVALTADRIVVLEHGRVAVTGVLAELIAGCEPRRWLEQTLLDRTGELTPARPGVPR